MENNPAESFNCNSGVLCLDEKLDKICSEEIEESFVRSSGPGGQKVNKTSSKVELRWSVVNSKYFSDEEKQKIFHKLDNRINKMGELIIVADEERYQSDNRRLAVERLKSLISDALKTEKVRKATKPTRSAKEKRLEEKKVVGEKKKARGKVNIEY